MAIEASITAPDGMIPDNFYVSVVFALPVTDFDDADVTLTALTGNGITGVTFQVNGMVDSYSLDFTLPTNETGSFRIELTGMVMREGVSTAEAIMANAVEVEYDTQAATTITAVISAPSNVTDNYGSLSARVAFNIFFDRGVRGFDSTDVNLTAVSGNGISNIDVFYSDRILGDNWTGLFNIPKGLVGSFSIEVTGQVTEVGGTTPVPVSSNVVTVEYDTRLKLSSEDVGKLGRNVKISERRRPPSDVQLARYSISNEFDLSKPFDIRVEFIYPITGWHQDNTTDVFTIIGTQLGDADAYKWIGVNPPSITEFSGELPDPLPSEWQLLTAPPPGFTGPWYGEEGRIFLMRFANVPLPGSGVIFNVDINLNRGAIRGQ